MTPETLAKAIGCSFARANLWAAPLTQSMQDHGITTPSRQAAFLAQIGHESMGLFYVAELWGPTEAQSRYEGRADLGNTQTGDGYRYRGRGLIQITGRANYAAASKALGHDFMTYPDDMTAPEWAAQSSAWWWESHGLNALSDRNNFAGITRTINGGLNGLADRQLRWDLAKKGLGVTA